MHQTITQASPATLSRVSPTRTLERAALSAGDLTLDSAAMACRLLVSGNLTVVPQRPNGDRSADSKLVMNPVGLGQP